MTKSRANMIAKYRFAEMTEEGIQPKTRINNMFKAAKLQEEVAFTKMPEDTEAQVFEAMLDQLEKIDLDRCYQEFPLQYHVTRDAIQEELEEDEEAKRIAALLEEADDHMPEDRTVDGYSTVTGCYIGFDK